MESDGAVPTASGAAAAPNPFGLLAEAEWGRLVEEEKQRRRAAAAAARELPVDQKQTLCSRMHAVVDPEGASADSLQALLKDEEAGPARAALEVALPDYVSRHRENMRDFIAKKRQIFLVQMSLDNKRTEISKLDQRSRQRAEALQASEDALEEDAKQFEDYLKENDQKLQEALRRADAEAKARQEKVNEAKKLAASILSMKNEMQRTQEQLQECQRYKEFIARVTPEEWFEELRAERDAKKAAMKEAWRADCAALAQRKLDAAAGKQRAEHDMQWARTQQQFERAERRYREALGALREALALRDLAEPDYSVVDTEEEGMYFTDPAQLLEVFSQLEGRNMFMIQTVQDAEQALEAARAAQATARNTLGAEVAALQRLVADMEAAIGVATERCSRLQEATTRNFQGGGCGGAHAAVSLGALVETLTRVYEQCGFSADASVTPLQMLAKVEARLEESLSTVEASLPPGLAEQVEKAREKGRRDAARQVKLAAQQAEHEARVQRVLDRAAAPPFQKTGKLVMFRTTLQRKERTEGAAQQQQANDDEAELRAYLALEG